MSKPSLKDILVEDEKNAKSSEFKNEILPAGEYDAKILGFTEEETYQYVAVEINKKRYNFFYNYYLRDTETLNADVIKWIKALATIKVTPKTTLLEIANSAVGSTFKITVYNYTSKTGKNAGKEQHAISFRDEPVKVNTKVDIEDEELDLPY